ncbi:MAG: hypothetical protein Q4G03_06980 [Planctomycetia bacterium]|nr:hypothetical protein [Planctomycetia bacterium]
MKSLKQVFRAILALYVLALCTPSQAKIAVIDDQPQVFIMQVSQFIDVNVDNWPVDNAHGMAETFSDERRIDAPKNLVALTVGDAFQTLPIKRIVERRFSDFVNAVDDEDIAIFYYNGLAFSFSDQSDLHLLTADAALSDYVCDASEEQIERLLTYSVSVQEIVSALNNTGARRVIILLDIPVCLEIDQNAEDAQNDQDDESEEAKDKGKNKSQVQQICVPMNFKASNDVNSQTIIWTSIGVSSNSDVENTIQFNGKTYSAFTGLMIQALQYLNSPADANHDGQASFFETVQYVTDSMKTIRENDVTLSLYHYGLLTDFNFAHGKYNRSIEINEKDADNPDKSNEQVVDEENTPDSQDEENDNNEQPVVEEEEEDDNGVGIIIESVQPGDVAEADEDEEYEPFVTIEVISNSQDDEDDEDDQNNEEDEEEDDNGVGIIIESVA